MEVYLVFDAFDPPVGRARVGGNEVSFEGWIGLMRSMTDFLKAESEGRAGLGDRDEGAER